MAELFLTVICMVSSLSAISRSKPFVIPSWNSSLIHLGCRPLSRMKMIKSVDLSIFNQDVFELHHVQIAQIEPNVNNIEFFVTKRALSFQMFALIIIPSDFMQYFNVTLIITETSQIKIDGHNLSYWRKAGFLPPPVNLFRAQRTYLRTLSFLFQLTI